MRYQIRLLDRHLPDLNRDLALGCWKSTDALLLKPAGARLYRSLYRAVRDVLKAHVHAFRFCGLGGACGQDLKPTYLGVEESREKFPPEAGRMHIFLCEEDTPPSKLVNELLYAALRVVIHHFPRRPWKGLARLLRHRIERTLRGKIFKSDFCGDVMLCGRNEPIDEWDLRS